MDADFFRRIDFGQISECLDSLDPEIGLVLEQLTEKSREDVEDELFKTFELKALMESRATIFTIAMDKIDLCLSLVAKARDLATFVPNDDEVKQINRANKLFRKITPKDMINRKCSKKAIKDIVDLLVYIGDDKAVFPVMMMKTKANANARNPKGGITVGDMVCLRHLSDLMVRSCGEDAKPGRVISNDTGMIDGNKDAIVDNQTVMKDNRQNGDRLPGKGKDARFLLDERVPSRMSGNFIFHGKRRSRHWNNEYSDLSDDLSDNDQEPPSAHSDIIVGALSDMNESSSDEEDQYIADPGQTSNLRGDMNTLDHTSTKPVPSQVSTDVHDRANEAIMNAPDENEPELCLDANERPTENDPSGVTNGNAEIRRQQDSSNLQSAYEYSVARPNPDQHEAGHTFATHSTNESESERIAPTPANVVINIGGRAIRIDISSLFEMASKFPTDLTASQMGASDHRDGCCSACDRRADEHARMVIESEDRLNEKIRKLRLDNEELVDELVKVNRKLREVSISHPVPVPTREPGRTRGDPELIQRENDLDVRRKKVDRKRQDQFEPRQRAATLNGPVAHNSRQVPRDMDRQIARGVLHTRPQRPDVGGAKERPSKQGGGDRDVTQKDNPLRSWLTKKGPEADITPADSKKNVYISRSPSWAEDDSFYDDASGGSSTPVPTPPLKQRTGSTAPVLVLRPEPPAHDVGHQEVDDVYLLPPSGQNTGKNMQRNDRNAEASRVQTDHRGARPKTRGKGVNNVEKNTKSKPTTNVNVRKPANSRDGRNRGESYAKVVSRNGWNTVQKKRKFDRVSPRAAFPLLGIPATVNREVYLQGLRLSEGMDADDVMDSVKAYCLDRVITPVYLRAIPVKYDCTRTGCKLTVCEEDYERVIDDEFWPEDISVRDWTPKVRDNQNNGDGVRPPSDDDDL